MTDRITFNVGGIRYEMSKSVVELFPEDSMLDKICSETWNKDPSEEVLTEMVTGSSTSWITCETGPSSYLFRSREAN